MRQKQVIEQIWFLLLGGLAIAYGLDVWAGHDFPIVLALSVGGSFISYIYSAPPIKLKQNGWLGNYALGSSYISLPWWCGQAMFGELNIQASCYPRSIHEQPSFQRLGFGVRTRRLCGELFFLAEGTVQ